MQFACVPFGSIQFDSHFSSTDRGSLIAKRCLDSQREICEPMPLSLSLINHTSFQSKKANEEKGFVVGSSLQPISYGFIKYLRYDLV